ncbi:MAG: hypothetical protein JHC95_03685 [Solirubrobacteraceae bacterium]|nr:hypothetical protein [Solirubrobacteraceae bacterium]
MPTVEGAGVELSFEVRADGPPVLFIHDMGSSAAGAPPLAGRVITYDRRGYGASGAPDPYAATTIHEQAEDAVAVLRAAADGPATLVGMGFGALIALDLLVRHAALASGAVLVDAPAFAFVPSANEPLAAERLALEEALRADPHAVSRAALADYAGRASWSPSRRDLRGIEVSVALVVTEGAPPHVAAATDALATYLPRATRATDVAGALPGIP